MKGPTKLKSRMIGDVLFTASGVACVCLAVWLTRQSSPVSGKLTAATSLINLGEMGQQVSKRFTIDVVNDCHEARTILSVDSSCSCTLLSISDRRVAPFQTLSLVGEYKSSGARGAVNSSVAILSSIEGHPGDVEITQVQIHAMVRPTFSVSPEEVTLSPIAPQADIYVTRDGAPAKLLGVTATESFVNVETDFSTSRIRVSYITWPPDLSKCELIVDLDSKIEPRVVVKVVFSEKS